LLRPGSGAEDVKQKRLLLNTEDTIEFDRGEPSYQKKRSNILKQLAYRCKEKEETGAEVTDRSLARNGRKAVRSKERSTGA